MALSLFSAALELPVWESSVVLSVMWLDVVAHAFNSSSWETEADR